MPVLNWIVEHWASLVFIGTAALIVYRFLKGWTSIVAWFHTSWNRFENSESTIHLIATNHLPHLQVEMEKVNEHLAGIRDDLRFVMANRKADD